MPSIFDQIDAAAKEAPARTSNSDLFAQIDAAAAERNKPSLLSRVDAFMRTPVAPGNMAQPMPAIGLTGPEDPSGGTTPEQNAQLDPVLRETALRMGVPLAAAALAPVSGGATLPLALGAMGGFAGEVAAQQSEMGRGARDQASYGRMVAAPIMAGVPLGPAASTSVRAFDQAGNLLAVAPQAILKRGAFGAGIGAGASGIEQTVDGKKIDWSEVANSAAFSAVFGGVMGGVETLQRTRAAQSEIFQLRKATGNFQGSDADFLTWVKAKAAHRGGTAMPAEEGAPVPDGQIQPLIETSAAPAPRVTPVEPAPVAPENFMQGSSVVERLPHTQEVAGSIPAPAPTSPEAPIATADPAQENADLNPAPATPIAAQIDAVAAEAEIAPAPAALEPAGLLEFAKSKLPPTVAAKITDEAQVESFRAQWEKERAAAQPTSDVQTIAPTDPAAAVESTTEPAIVGGPAPAPESVSNEAGAGSGVAEANPVRIREDLPEAKPIIARLDELTRRGEARQAKMAPGQVKDLTHPQDMLTPAEKNEFHALQLRLRRKTPAEAKADLVLKRKATVTPTPTGPKIAPKPTEDVQVSHLADRKQIKAQREFLLDAVNKARETAPETGRDKLTIEVPGDGTFTIDHTKDGLKRFADAVEVRFGKKFNVKITRDKFGNVDRSVSVIVPAPFSELPASSRMGGKPETVPPVIAKPSVDDLTKAAKLAASTDQHRIALHPVLNNDGFAIATDGHVMNIVAGGGGKTDVQILKDHNVNYLNWRAALPPWLKVNSGIIAIDKKLAPKPLTVNTRELLKSLDQASRVLGEKEIGVRLHELPNNKIGVSSFGKELGDYMSEGVTETSQPFTKIDPDILRNGLVAARMAGHETVQVYPWTDKGVVIKGGENFASIVMDMKPPKGETHPPLKNAGVFPGAATKTPAAPRGAAASPGMPTSPPMQGPAMPPGAPTMLRPVDNPDFSQFPIQLPEAVQFFRLLSNGQNPRIVEKIRALHGTALGVFRYREGDLDSGKIELRADLFHLLSPAEKKALLDKAVAWASLMKQANPDLDWREAVKHKFEELVKEAEAEAMKRDPARALAVFWHEIGHWIDFLPEGTLRRGNLFGHLASLHGYLKNFIGNAPDIFPFPPTDSERAALKRKAQKEIEDSVKTITETITREEPIYQISGITPKMVTEIVGQTARDDFPEFYDWFAQLSRADKVAVLKQAMKGIVDERAARFGKREQVGTKTITEEVTRTVGEISPEAIAKRYAELLREELKKRGLISLKDIKHELEGAIAWWHKRETMPDYFRSAAEMYAETFSILMNNPAALRARAPTWWSAFQQYMVRKPAVKAMYEKVQEDIKSGVIYAARVKNLRESWIEDEKAGLTRDKAANGVPWRQFWDTFQLLFNKQQGPIQALAAKQLGKPSSDKLLSALKDYLYRQTAVEGLARQINMHVEAPLAANDLTHADMAEYMFHQRIVAGDAVETANSQGWSPNTSTQRLQEMAQQLGPMRFGALAKSNAALRAIYEAGPVKLLEASQTLKPELMQKIKENAAYSPSERAREAFNPLDEGTIRGMLESAYGETATARIFRRLGSFQDIKSPYVALVKKAEALTRFAYKQIATKSMRDFLLEFNSDQIEKAPKSYNGHRLVPKDIDSPKVGTIYTLDNGELNGWYVPRAIFETLEHASGAEQMMLGGALRLLSWPKAILTELNFGFWPVNFARDLAGFGIQMKGGIGALKRLPQAYGAARATITSKPNEVADQLLSRLMVISRADPRGEHLGHPDEMDRWLLRANKHPELWQGEAKKMGLGLRLWEAYKAQGQILERTTKALGMMHLDAKYGHPIPDVPGIQWVTMPEWMKKRTVNELSGSPDFNERGRGIAFVEVAGGPIFANAWLRGIESFYKAQKQDPAGVWTKFLLFFGLPALALFAYEHGWNPPGTDPKKNEDDREQLRAVPERDKLRGFVKTLGWVDRSQKKVAYVVLPFPEQPRMLHAMWRKLLQTAAGDQGRKVGAGSFINYQGQDLPGQNPLLSEGGKWWDFAVLGQNPYDAFRGKPVLDDKVFAAGQGAGELARQTVSNLSGNMIPAPQHQIPGDKPADLEKDLHRIGVSNSLGRWLKVSNAGITEQDQAVVQPVQQRRAQLQIVGDEMIRKITAQEQWTDSEKQLLSVEPYLAGYMLDRFKVYQSGASGPEVRDFMKANNEERAALLKSWVDREKAIEQRLWDSRKAQP